MEETVKAGADAIKIQTYINDTMTIDCDHDDFQIKGGLWVGQSLFDFTAVDLLEKIKCTSKENSLFRIN